jgi:hypothetical protein
MNSHQNLNWLFKLHFLLHFDPQATFSSPLEYKYRLVEIQARGYKYEKNICNFYIFILAL